MKKAFVILVTSFILGGCSIQNKQPNLVTQPKGAMSPVNPTNIKLNDLEDSHL